MPLKSLDQMIQHMYRKKFDRIPGKFSLKNRSAINLQKEVAISQLNFVEQDVGAKKNTDKKYKSWESNKLKQISELDLQNTKLDIGQREYACLTQTP